MNECHPWEQITNLAGQNFNTDQNSAPVPIGENFELSEETVQPGEAEPKETEDEATQESVPAAGLENQNPSIK